MTEPADFTEDQLLALLGTLLNGWDAERASRVQFESKAHAARVGSIYALAAHTHRLGRAVQTLLANGFGIEAVPVVRAAFESAITAAWIQQVDDAMPAYLNRNHGQQKALRDTVLKTGWSAMLDTETIHADGLEPFNVSKQSKQAARKTEDLCNDLAVESQAYAVYRGLSWFAHPTAAVTDLYLHLRDGATVPTLQKGVKSDPEFMIPWLHVMCSTLVWSARTLNLIDRRRADTPERQRLRRAADDLRITEMLTATPEAIARGKKAERERLRAKPPA